MIKGVKFKTPPRESDELGRFYDLVFAPEAFFASWAGCIGHYAYAAEKKPWGAADNQDGYIYLWPETRQSIVDTFIIWRMSAHPAAAHACCREFVEINL
ncbi:hypothetical protein NLN92_18970 [Citrobacter portucalensis]|uniref:hypothetical protein n=1 Tax=Citrobacter portucalensis TaxID=1639133 RepID=UPI00226BA5F7|nr:hypothetical protein [Citrobacter portucalensis]MCX8980089.1 hypothetical protein [Citrobacter portucalensis]